MRGGTLRFWIVLGFFAAALCGPAPAFAKEQTVYHVPPNKIAYYIAKKKGRKKAVVVWASWCPFCRKNMPAYIRQEKRTPGSMILISVDHDLEQLREYLDRTDLAPIKIIVCADGALCTNKISFRGSAWTSGGGVISPFWRAHFEKCFSASAVAVSRSMSPTAISADSFGAKTRLAKFLTSESSIFRTVSCDPSTGRPYGCVRP